MFTKLIFQTYTTRVPTCKWINNATFLCTSRFILPNKSQAIYESKILKHKYVIPTMIPHFKLIIISGSSAFKLKKYSQNNY